MFSFNWPLITVTTVILYALTILSLPFNTAYATIMLFSLIAFWSRLPGVCIMEPVRFLYMMDFIDIFAVIIAIYVGPFQGAAFALVWNIFPRLCGAYTNYLGNVKDGIAQAIICLIIPFVNIAVGGNLVLVMIIFSVIRMPLFFLLCLFIPHRTIPEQLFHIIVGGTAVVIINGFYAKLFGNFFINLFSKGASFSWVLFMVASIIILVFAVIVFGFSPKKTGRHIGTGIAKIVKHQRKKKKPETKNADAEDMRLARESAKQNKF